MKVWLKDKRYKVRQNGKSWEVFFEDVMIGKGIYDEEQARKCIWRHIGMKEYVFGSDFEEIEDEL